MGSLAEVLKYALTVMATSTPSRARQGTWRCAARKFILGGSLAPGARRFTEWSATSWSAWDDDDDDDDDDDELHRRELPQWFCQDNEVWHGGLQLQLYDCTDKGPRLRWSSTHFGERWGAAAADLFICSGNTLQHGYYEDGEWKERYEAPASLHCYPNCEDQSESILFGA